MGLCAAKTGAHVHDLASTASIGERNIGKRSRLTLASQPRRTIPFPEKETERSTTEICS